ncbi:MAG: histidine ammonia-lyase [Bacteroidota bacterium]
MNTHQISSDTLSCKELDRLISNGDTIRLSEEAIQAVEKNRAYLDSVLEGSTNKIYGINTGFGALHNIVIPKDKHALLQEKLIISHACGVGDEIPMHIAKTCLLLKIQNLSYGFSAVNKSTLDRLVEFYNRGVIPVLYEQGSLGASGDLAPLAHLALPLIGEGQVYFKGQKLDSMKVLDQMGMQPLNLGAKEGLALLNGTQFMSAYGVWGTNKLRYLLKIADFIAAISLEAFDGRIDAFDPAIHEVRKHKGQRESAQNIRYLLDGSEIATTFKKHTQDPYSFRCVPQVHGASRDALRYIENVFENEINSVTDNPLVFDEHQAIISGGNFHGQPLALALDHLCLAAAELGSISERRLYKLLSGQRELPSFLVDNPGLNSGFMIVQYTAASIVSQNKHLCMPASVDTIDSSQGQEDHVSMGANAATKMYRVLNNVEKVLAYEFFAASQAIQYRRPKRTSGIIEAALAMFAQEVPFIEEDDLMYPFMNKSHEYIQKLKNTNFLSSII